MQPNALITENLQSDSFFDWLAINQFKITIIVLALLSVLLVVVAIRLFRQGGRPRLRNIRDRSTSSRRNTKGVPQSSIAGWTLVDVTGQAIPLSPLPFTIGRVGGNTLVLDDPSIAARHARILYDPNWGSIIIEDLNSPGGIQVEGLPTQQNLLHPGMHLTIGRYSFTLTQQAP